jgi:hypothetical protein
MTIYVATSYYYYKVEIFLSPPVHWFPLRGSFDDGACPGYWEEEGLTMSRKAASETLDILPVHGSKEVLAYEVTGNGRLVQ